MNTRSNLLHLGQRPAAPTIHLTSLLVQVTPQGHRALLESTPFAGMRLHPTASPNKLVATLEAPDERAAAAAAEQLLAVRGVLTVAVISHLTESAAALDQEVDP